MVGTTAVAAVAVVVAVAYAMTGPKRRAEAVVAVADQPVQICGVA